MDFVGQGFGQSIVEMSSLYSMMSEASAKKIQTAGGESAAKKWNYMKVPG